MDSPVYRGSSCPVLDNVLRLSWDSFADYELWRKQNEHMVTQIWLWHETLGNRESSFQLPGICSICKIQTTFSMESRKSEAGDQFAYRTSWWAGSQCACNLSALERSVLQVLFDWNEAVDNIYHVGHHSHFRHWLSSNKKSITSSQYEEGRRPGEIEGDIRYEDLTALSFPNGRFDSIICMEILEHIPNYKLALCEMARTLKAGGRALMSFPWLGGSNYEHLTRAEMREDGSINHILPPEYHGDPAKPEGILSYRSFGWKILDELREAGFTKASAKVVFGPLHGFYTALCPVVVGVR